MSSADLLQYATEELRSYITAFLKGIREEFIVVTLDIAVTSGTVAAPYRAVGAALRTIGWVQSDGRVRPLPRFEPENAGGYAGQTGEPQGYIFEGNNFLLLPTPSSGTLRLTYQQRPGQLVETSACALVSSFSGSGIVSLAVPTAMQTGVAGVYGPFDFVSSRPNFVALALDVPGTAASSTTITLTTPSTLQAGDYVCFAGETCIPQVPTEVHDLLAQATAYKIAQATGSARAAAIKAGLDDLREQMTQILSPRSDGSARVIVSKSRIGRWGLGW